jgi:hypothetical protein
MARSLRTGLADGLCHLTARVSARRKFIWMTAASIVDHVYKLLPDISILRLEKILCVINAWAKKSACADCHPLPPKPGAGGHAGCGGAVGYVLEGYPVAGQGFDLFAATSRHKRVTTFQPENALTFVGRPNQQVVDGFLRTVCAGCAPCLHRLFLPCNQLPRIHSSTACQGI